MRLCPPEDGWREAAEQERDHEVEPRRRCVVARLDHVEERGEVVRVPMTTGKAT